MLKFLCKGLTGEWDSQDGEKKDTESKERDILIEEAIVGLARNLVLEKFLGVHKDDPI